MSADLVTVTLRGVGLELHQYDAITSAIEATGDFYEAEVLDGVRARRPSEQVVLDIGANVGNHAAYWAALDVAAFVVAFEPLPESYDILRRNLAAYPHALALPLAVSDATRWVALRRDDANRGRTCIHRDGTVRALAVRLDDLAIENVSLVKVDVEGHQAAVLRSAHQTLRRWHPAVLVEDEEHTVADTFEHLGLDGYRVVETYPGENYLWEWGT